ncbi:VOC family protein [uncultured Mailhella sp.]|uniref:VOC family protein n=1 Tax=uncultured Mailhella sp. TaxID=1981031 RepID=UPI0026174ABE|nr:VOC family protein [uncultured Mailhella sp.]
MKLAHLHILVREIDPAVDFVTEVLKGKLQNRDPLKGSPSAEILVDGLKVCLKEVGKDWELPQPTAKVCGYNHIAFSVESLDAALAEVLAAPGVRLAVEPFIISDRKLRCAFIAGPGEIYVELMESLKD